MRIHFSWGTGILLFLILFVCLAIGFIFFAYQYDINLVEKDYYDKGASYTQQMEVNSRSLPFQKSIHFQQMASHMLFVSDSSLTYVDSLHIRFFRPSDRFLDKSFHVAFSDSVLIPTKDIATGRYLLHISWIKEGLSYQIEKECNIN